MAPVGSGACGRGVRVGQRGSRSAAKARGGDSAEARGGAGYAGGDASTAAAKHRREAALGLLPALRGASLSSALCVFGGGVVVARPWVSGQSVFAAPWCRGGDALPDVSGGTSVVRPVILVFMEAVAGGRSSGAG
jgi:hypothetical protein